MSNQKIKNIIYGIIFIASFSLIFFTCMLLKWIMDNQSVQKINDEIIKIVTPQLIDKTDSELINSPAEESASDYWHYASMPLLDVDFNELLKYNNDIKGFIKVEGTNINYPVVQTIDNEYYLNHALDKSKNNAGWIFFDYRNNLNQESFDSNTIIYGHSRLDKTMFGTLKDILKEDWFKNKDNHVVRLATLNGTSLWQIISVYKVPEETKYLQIDFTNLVEFENWLNEMKGRSIYDFNGKVNNQDKILTLSTCYSSNGSRVVLHAKLIKHSYE